MLQRNRRGALRVARRGQRTRQPPSSADPKIGSELLESWWRLRPASVVQSLAGLTPDNILDVVGG
jgi:hypothetical protein